MKHGITLAVFLTAMVLCSHSRGQQNGVNRDSAASKKAPARQQILILAILSIQYFLQVFEGLAHFLKRPLQSVQKPDAFFVLKKEVSERRDRYYLLCADR
jgi:hypothetical protein